MQSLGKGANGEDLAAEAQQNTEQGNSPVGGDGRKGSVNRQDDKYQGIRTRGTGGLQETGVELELGRLVVDEGTSRSRYVSNGFWTALSEQVCCTSYRPSVLPSLSLSKMTIVILGYPKSP